MELSPELIEKARKIRMVLMDVDGVMTDGTLTFFGDGTEVKVFHAQDGVGIRLAQRAGLEVGVITGRRSRAVEARCRELDIQEVHQGDWRKLPAFEEILRRRGLGAEEVCFIGDDLVDLPLLRRAGLAITVPGARPEVMAAAHACTDLGGGRGAVRDALEAILKAQGRWEELLGLYP
ncbi:MAG: HAD hydrolase family protein [Acidobacteriota bacterium]|jgi:3-deoxy-D-manno-octulosonate 8-phosphate phosphatase (KDO 8-P phosphatase)